MKIIRIIAMFFMLFKATQARAINESELHALSCKSPDYGPIRSVVAYLFNRNDITEKEFSKYYTHEAVDNSQWEKNIFINTIGLKKIGSLPWHQELLTEDLLWPGDGSDENAILYELVQHVRVKNDAEKMFEFLVISNVTDNDCSRSTPLLIEVLKVSPYFRILGSWESNLQAWERIKNKEKEISPNLVK